MPDSPTLDPQTTIVLAMDFQPGIISRIPEGEQALEASPPARSRSPASTAPTSATCGLA